MRKQRIGAYLLFSFILAIFFSFAGLAAEFQQSPLLARMVEEGLIPELAERLPAEPEVVEPLHRVGRYGGTARVYNAEAPSRPYTAQMLMGSHGPFGVTPDAKPGVPDVFKSYEVNDDFTEWTFHLREGLKWSDGHPLTAENFLLYWKYDRGDPRINESIQPKNVTVEENSVTFYNEHAEKRTVKKEAVDDYTIKYTSDIPYPLLINHMSHYHYTGEFHIVPMHFMKQFHPDFIGEEKAKELAEKGGFDNWIQLYEHFSPRQNQQTTVQVLGNFPPSLSPYVCVQKTQNKLIFERNPFYYKVDPEGKQLPYIDKIIVEQVAKREIINGKIISGEADFEGFMTQTVDIPLFKKYEAQGNYRTELWNFAANASVYYLNYCYNDPVVSELFREKKFRMALELGINRDRINDEVLFGKGKIQRYSVLDNTIWWKPEYGTKYVEYDPERAKELLDEIGVTDKDGDGWRENAEGKDIAWTVEYIVSEAPRQPISEIVRKNWRELGLKVDVKQEEANLGFTRSSTNDMAVWIWHGDNRTELLWFGQSDMLPDGPGNCWAEWWNSDGQAGEEPPEKVKEIFEWGRQMRRSTSREEVKKWGQKILDEHAENIWHIDTVNDFPHPMIVKNDIKNFPTEEDGPLFYIWSTWWTDAYYPEQFYFEDRPQVKYEDSLLTAIYPVESRKDPVERAKENGWL